MVENITMSFRMTESPKVLRGRAESYELYPLFTYSRPIGYWEVYRRLQGGFFLVVGGSGVMWEDLSMGEGTLL